MKALNIKFIILFCAVVTLFASCTNLDVDVKSQYTKMPDSEEAIEAVTAEIYNPYRTAMGRQHWMAQTLSTDEAVGVSMGADYYDGGVYRQMSVHNWDADNNMLGTMWNGAMTGITTCNKILKMLSEGSAKDLAPIRTMKAYYHFLLMDNFGDVPIMDDNATEHPDRSKRADVCKFIESELLAAKDSLTTEVSSATYGKATRYMNEALLAKLYLNWAVYTADNVTNYTSSSANEKLNDCVAMCDDIIQSGLFALTDSFMVKFRPDNGSQIKDFIFAMPYDRETQQGMVHARFWKSRSGKDQFGVVAAGPAGNIRCLPEFYDKFNLPGDDRNLSYVTGKQYYWSNYEMTDKPFMIETTKNGYSQDYLESDKDNKIQWQMTYTREITLRSGSTLDVGNDQRGRAMGYRSIKFYPDVNATAAQGHNQSNDMPIFRYADILLMKAEAILRGANATKGDTPMSLMNQIRTYVHAPKVTKDPTLDEILDERAREFADESWRRNDLIRYGKFENNWGFRYLYEAGFTEKFRRIFPVSTSVLNTNTNWKQNSGY
jgi:SusD family.